MKLRNIQMQNDIKKSYSDSNKLIFQRLKVSEDRIQEVEITCIDMKRLRKDQSEFERKFHDVAKFLDANKSTSLYVERYLPILVHFMISEALFCILAESFPTKVHEYEKSKLAELLDFCNNYRAIEPNLNKL